MTKLRVHELAKELDKTNKEVLDFLKKENVDVKSHMSSLEEEQVLMVKKAFSSNPEEEKRKRLQRKRTLPWFSALRIQEMAAGAWGAKV